MTSLIGQFYEETAPRGGKADVHPGGLMGGVYNRIGVTSAPSSHT